MSTKFDCYQCGVCCIFYDISSLNKVAGVPCEYLKDNKCSRYETRPSVCRNFKADEICYFISTLSFDNKMELLRRIYGD